MVNGDRGDAGAISLFLVIIILVFLFIWPGTIRYQYSFRDNNLIRIDRLTGGRVSHYSDGKYRHVQNIEVGRAGAK